MVWRETFFLFSQPKLEQAYFIGTSCTPPGSGAVVEPEGLGESIDAQAVLHAESCTLVQLALRSTVE